MNLQNKVVVITGASQGIGEAAAKEFAKNGCKVVLAARSEDLLENIAKEIKNNHGEAYVVKTDVSKISEIKNLAKKTLAKYGRIDVWINNAGFQIGEDAISAKEEWVNRIFQVNLLGVYWGMRFAVDAMKKNKSNPRGIIVNVSSIVTEAPLVPRFTLYKATKQGVDTLSEGLSLELSPLNIRVINVKPGFTATNFTKNVLGRKGRYSKIGISPEVVARKIVKEVRKEKSNRRVLITFSDEIMLFLIKLLDFPARFVIRNVLVKKKE